MAIDFKPESASIRSDLAETYLRKGMHEEAIFELEKVIGMSDEPVYLAQLGYTYAMAGRKDEASVILKQLENQTIDEILITLVELSVVMGKKNRALSMIEKAFGNKNRLLLDIRTSIVYDSLRNDISFQKILEKINFPAERIEIESPD